MNRGKLFTSAKIQKYKELLPNFQEEKTQAFTTLILSFVALSFFGFFAISPTISKIIELNKQLEDYQFTNQRLSEKINSLSILYQKYTTLLPDLPIIFSAIPQKPDAAFFLGKTQTVSQAHNINLRKLQTSQVELFKGSEGASKYSSFSFSLDAEGSYDQLLSFIGALAKIDRILSFDAITISASDEHKGLLVLNIRGKAYFKN